MNLIEFEERLRAPSLGLDALRKTFNRTTEGMTIPQKLIYVTDMGFNCEKLKEELLAQSKKEPAGVKP